MLKLKTQEEKRTTLKKDDVIVIGMYIKKRGAHGETTQTTHNIWVEREGKILHHDKKDTDAFMDELFNNVQFLPQMVKKIRAFKKLIFAFSKIELENEKVRNFLNSKERSWGYEFPLKITYIR